MAEQPRGTTLPGTKVLTLRNASILVAATTGKQALWQNREGSKIKITAIDWLPDTAVTGAATNNLALEVINAGLDGLGTTSIADKITYASGTDAAALDEKAQVLSTTAANLEIDDKEVIALDKTNNGTGLPLPAGIWVIQFQHIGP